MPQEQNFKLSITLAGNGSGFRDVIELYRAQIQRDIDQTAWNLCGCDDQLQTEKFGSLKIMNWTTDRNTNKDYVIQAHFSVLADDPGFIQNVIQEYMDGFPDFLVEALNGFYSRTGRKPAVNLHPLNWEIDVQ